MLEFQPASKWASPSFIISKKDNTVRFISDFREANKRLVRKPFPIPKISTMLQELERFTFATALDLWFEHGLLYHSFGSWCIQNLHHHFSMEEVFLPQVTNGYSRFSQHLPSKDVQACGSLRVHKDLFGWSLIHHQGKPGRPSRSLETSPYQVARSRLESQCVETEYLRYILTRTDIKPQPNKVKRYSQLHY